ncbi:hypothetical protein FTX61_18500 [Nitriliruptoraceae bacterium ZYF776]|nr:hypothetical protein [Profundirhabdus halotolerans]
MRPSLGPARRRARRSFEPRRPRPSRGRPRPPSRRADPRRVAPRPGAGARQVRCERGGGVGPVGARRRGRARG